MTKNEFMAEKRVLELRKLLQRANKAYYDQATPFMSDLRADELLKRTIQS